MREVPRARDEHTRSGGTTGRRDLSLMSISPQSRRHMFGKGGQGTAATLIPASILSHQDDWGGDRTPSTAALTRVQSAVRNGSVYESDVIRSHGT